MRIALIQCDIVFEDPDANLKRFGELTARAVDQGAELVVFPEMSATGYSLKPEKVAEPEGGRVFQAFVELARERSVAVAFGQAVARDGRYFNACFVVDPGGRLVYRFDKVHPFSFTGEDRLYHAGDSLSTFQLSPDGPRISGVVCYDLRFPELFTAAAADTDLFLVIANWPRERAEHWKLLLQARALDSLSFVAGVNRVGTGGKLTYQGDSMVVGAWGETIAVAGPDEEVLLADIDPARVREVRAGFSLLKDRREFGFHPGPAAKAD